MIRFKVSAPEVRFDAKDERPVRMGVNPVEALRGEDGKSAYEIAVENGFEGTKEEWLDSLHGKDGKDGEDGKDGKDGKDAEETLFIAIQNQSTWDEVKQAIDDGKFVIAKANTTYYTLTNHDSSLIRFSRAYQSTTYHITLNTSDKWAAGSTTHAKSNHTHVSSDITFTDDDKEALAEYVRSTLPVYNGEVESV